MKKLSLVVLVALMAFAANVFAQDATKTAGQEQPKTTEVKKAEVKKEAVKSDAKPSKKHHKKAKKAVTPEQK